MNTQREVFNKLFKEEKTELATQKIELGAIEDAIKEKQKEATILSNKANGYAANARDVSSSINRAESKYKEAKKSFEKFQSLEKEFNDELDNADKNYNIIKRDGFKALNDFDDANLELKKYGASIKGFKDNSKELLKADADWKSIPNKFKKIK
jgi:chromosome segregation ATPase